MPEEKIKILNPVVSQMVYRKLGMYCSERLNVDVYYLLEAINLLVSDVGEDFLIKKYKEQGKDWSVIKDKLDSINKHVMKIKIFYDPIQDKKFDKKDTDKHQTQKMFERVFKKHVSKFALMQRDLYDLFIFLVSNTSIQRGTIPAESFKVLEHQNFRKMDLTKKPTGIPSTDPTSS